MDISNQAEDGGEKERRRDGEMEKGRRGEGDKEKYNSTSKSIEVRKKIHTLTKKTKKKQKVAS